LGEGLLRPPIYKGKRKKLLKDVAIQWGGGKRKGARKKRSCSSHKPKGGKKVLHGGGGEKRERTSNDHGEWERCSGGGETDRRITKRKTFLDVERKGKKGGQKGDSLLGKKRGKKEISEEGKIWVDPAKRKKKGNGTPGKKRTLFGLTKRARGFFKGKRKAGPGPEKGGRGAM